MSVTSLRDHSPLSPEIVWNWLVASVVQLWHLFCIFFLCEWLHVAKSLRDPNDQFSGCVVLPVDPNCAHWAGDRCATLLFGTPCGNCWVSLWVRRCCNDSSQGGQWEMTLKAIREIPCHSNPCALLLLHLEAIQDHFCRQQ